jgi:hypothetical protein
MSTMLRIVAVSLCSGALLVTLPRVACSQDADTKEVQRYVLTATGLAKYSQATRNLAALPMGQGRCDDDSDGESQSINDMVAKLEATPAAADAVQSTGMPLREYVVFSMSLLQNGLAAWALDQPGGKLPTGVAKANVDFVRQHDAELKRLGELRPQADCDETAEDDESGGGT